ncbi:MAG TPA: SGNH/GDSL hydrolase family protein [Gemmatimonadaceae bacterium]|nr:SGNH/GDSL hydrolase family protein [Gemmatimonadaceae bacterium]
MPRTPLRRTRMSVALSLAAALAALAPGTALAQGAFGPFTSLTVFGDSFSDTGNLLALTGGTQPPSPPYAPGRLSNGPLWVEYFAARVGRPADAAPVFLPAAPSGVYAVGVATTSPVAGGPPSTAEQVGRYLTGPGAADPTGLYVLFAGANDLGQASALPTDAARRAAAQAAAHNLAVQAGQLAGIGATAVLLPSLPDLGLTPGALAVPGRSAILSEMTDVFNEALAGELVALRGTLPGTEFLGLHLDNLFTNVLLDARSGGARYGLTNVSVPCLPPFAPPGAPSCDVSVFADQLHPTTRAHELIADAVYDRVVLGEDVGVVPEPTTLALVGGGLVALGAGAVRRRRRVPTGR